MKNEIGNKYGKLIIVKRAERPEGRPQGAYWLCQCECGNTKVARGADLRAGGVTSCGCLLGKHSIKNEIGNKYGKLTVLSQSEKRDFGSVCWVCKCECGNEVIVAGDALRSGSTKSCGCLVKSQSRQANGVDRTNKKYGLLTALEIDEIATNKHKRGLYWKCICECGNITTVLGANLQTGAIKSCGCLKISYGEMLIENLLQQNDIPYAKEYTFPDLRGENNILLRFDFAIFNHEHKLIQLIEFDGQQHYHEVSIWNGKEGLQHRQENDAKKNKYCLEHNIKLVRIPYTQRDNITLQLLELEEYIS